MILKSILVGKPKEVEFAGKKLFTSIFKKPMAGAGQTTSIGLVGDEISDRTVHGGLDKAIYAYGVDAYSLWKKIRPQENFEYGCMGENLPVETLDEEHIYVGDEYKVGSTVLQVSEPRFPCFKLGIMYNDPTIIKQFLDLKRPGVYFRVLENGTMNVGDRLELVRREKALVSIQDLFLFKEKKFSKGQLENFLEVHGLTKRWREKITVARDAIKN